ncbi:HNH endonuclease [Burkholderia gladioli]|uniref:HNH endonuclease n=1 Tax=Burkholderia gladioli TaxID=28095 RepID=UPI000CFFE42C|nr:HNH endonuclease signature motif containing protein [Burkholderia gladioli]PRH29040.1 hypothetical protein C6V07_31650 [Burkholderia gladioli]
MLKDSLDADIAGIDVSTRVSDLLQAGRVYTRDALRGILDTQDSTINNGVFRPAGFTSVLLFVTEKKTEDRTQYVDKLEGDLLSWQGQTAGRTDSLIIEHAQRGLEVLLFYRKKKYEYEGAGFRYEGAFRYVAHHGERPASFSLQRNDPQLALAEREVQASGDFDPSSIEDARSRINRAIVRRQGQPAFRRALLSAYDGRCAISGCEVQPVLEAAHIVAYRGPETNHVANGLLLRGDLHTLFDMGLLSIDPTTYRAVLDEGLRAGDDGVLNGRVLRLPAAEAEWPSKEALAVRHAEYRARSRGVE